MVVSTITGEGLKARTIINILLEGKHDNQAVIDYAELGPWAENVRVLVDIYQEMASSQGREIALVVIKSAVEASKQANPAFAQLMEWTEDTAPTILSPRAKQRVMDIVHAAHAPNAAIQAILDQEEEYAESCRWLSAFIDFSAKWANRAHHSFHEAIGLWLMSAVSMRRIRVDLGPKRNFTPLYVMIGSPSSAYTKTTACNIALDVLEQAGLSWIVQDSKITPEAFYHEAAGYAPQDYGQLPPDEQRVERWQVAHAGKRTLYFPELGDRVHEMLSPNGGQRKWLEPFLTWYDCPATDNNVTLSRGSDRVIAPFLSMLACCTPENFASLPKTSRSPWGAGLLARFCIVAPPRTERSREFFRLDAYEGIPPEVWQPLARFHEMLTPADVHINPKPQDDGQRKKLNGNGAEFTVEKFPYPENVCTLQRAAYEAMKLYDGFMQDIIDDDREPLPIDLSPWHSRAATIALHIAALLAAMGNGFVIEEMHMFKAICIVERFRKGMNEFYQQVRDGQSVSTRTVEDKTLQHLANWPRTHGQPLAAASEVANLCNIKTEEAQRILDALVLSGVIGSIERPAKKGTKLVKRYYCYEYAYAVGAV